MAMKRSRLVRELLELVAALDRRVPQAQRVGEMSIARDAAALKARAMKRIEEIEHPTMETFHDDNAARLKAIDDFRD